MKEIPPELAAATGKLTRVDYGLAALVFAVVFLEAVLLLSLPMIFLPVTRIPGWVATGLMFGVALFCAFYVTAKTLGERTRKRQIESLRTEGERLAVPLEGPHMTAFDYCLLYPVFAIACGCMEFLVFFMVLNRLFGIPTERLPYSVVYGVPAVLAAWITVSDARHRRRRRHERQVARRNKRLARRAAALARGRCSVCGYSLTGLPERRCPECGETWTEEEQVEANSKP
jgi:predicted Zn-ribbon and HTH transcriptional regulator